MNFTFFSGKILTYIYYDQQTNALKEEKFLILKSKGLLHVSPKVIKKTQFKKTKKNWRPISLLNCSLKLLSSIIVSRLNRSFQT